jgi:hypothetical protein
MNIQRTHTVFAIGSAFICGIMASGIAAATGCIANAQGSVTLGGASANFGSTLTIPYDLANNLKSLRVEVSPHPYNSLNTGVWQTSIAVKLNGTTLITGLTPALNPYNHAAGHNASTRLIPFPQLAVGNNQVCATGTCATGGGEQLIGCATVKVLQAPPPPPPGSGNTVGIGPKLLDATKMLKE